MPVTHPHPLKILYVGSAQGFGNAHKFYLFPQRLINGFTRLGHTVYVFNDRDVARHSNIFRSSSMGVKPMNETLIKTCRDYEPDLIVLGHCEKVTNDTLADIRDILPDLKIIYRNVDPLDCNKNRARLRNRGAMVDGIFVTTAGEVLKEFGAEKAFAAFLPNPVDASLDTGKSHLNEQNEVDLFFAASPLGESDRRRDFLTKVLKDLPDDVDFSLIGAGINDKRLFGAAFIRALSNASMGLILNKTEDYYLYASDRMSQYLGNGLLNLCPKGPRYTDIFSGGEIVEYDDENDLVEKVIYFKNNNAERRSIAEKGYRKAHDIFASDRVAQYMIDMTYGDAKADDYAWPIEKF